MQEPPNNGSSDVSLGDLSGRPPLAGQTIVVTRAAEQAESICQSLGQLGAKTISHPVIRILPPQNHVDVDRSIARIDEFDWVVFVSINAVRFFVERLLYLRGSTDKLKECKIAAIGRSTANELKRIADVDVDLVPPISNSRTLGASLKSAIAGQKLLIPRANRRTNTLTDILSQAGIEFEEVVIYRSCDVESVDPEVACRMADGTIDWVTITSGAIARSSVRVFGNELRNAKLASISPATSEVLREFGFEPTVQAMTYDMTGLVAAIEQHVTQKR